MPNNNLQKFGRSYRQWPSGLCKIRSDTMRHRISLELFDSSALFSMSNGHIIFVFGAVSCNTIFDDIDTTLKHFNAICTIHSPKIWASVL